MLKPRLERLKKLCRLELRKNFVFRMQVFRHDISFKLGVKCHTSGCLAALVDTDSYFTDLGYKMLLCDSKISLDGEEHKFYQPWFEKYQGFSALEELFELNARQVGYIFGAQNSNLLTEAIERIDKILNEY